MEDTRIPIEEFEDFASCRMVGQQFGQRYEFFCEAFAASLADPEQKFARTPYPRQLTIAKVGREPSEFTEVQQVCGEHLFAREPWGGRIG